MKCLYRLPKMFSFPFALLVLLCSVLLSLVPPSAAIALTPPNHPKKTFTIANGPKYAYVYSVAKLGKPTFLLLHGFPSSADEWHNQISDLTKAGYGVLAPDMLGYGDTDKPTEVEAYSFAKILDHEGLKEVIGVGHDWLVDVICASV
jgi:pimeloyl-ACP methyl ester carboxylesterase